MLDGSESFECPGEYKEWPELGVPPQIVKALVEMRFVSPTEIQRRVIPIALKRDADIVGAAETVSTSAQTSVMLTGKEPVF